MATNSLNVRSGSPDIFDESDAKTESSEGISDSMNSIHLDSANVDLDKDTLIEEAASPEEAAGTSGQSKKRPLLEEEEEEDILGYSFSSSSDDNNSKEMIKPTKREKKKKRRMLKEEMKRKNKPNIPSVSALPHSSDSNPRGTPYSTFYRMSAEHPSCPPVEANSHHTVLVKLPLPSEGAPKPHPAFMKDIWDANHVRMPYSPASLYPAGDDGGRELCSRWDVIYSALTQPINSIMELQEAVLKYNARYIGKWDFEGLRKLFETEFSEEEQEYFFGHTLPNIVDLALRLPEIVTTPPPHLSANSNHSITLSQLQIASLLANAFFCTYPRRNAKGYDTEYAKFPDINFNRLFFHPDQRCLQKMKCILNYFRIVTEQEPVGLVTFTRRSVKEMNPSDWKNSSDGLPNLHISHTGVIEEFEGFLQMDFANKRLGGGVLGKGCVQEEIRFALCPELIVSRLFTEVLWKNESLVFLGVEQYNSGTGYGDSFMWTGSHSDVTPRDSYGRRLCHMVALDALHFRRNKLAQYQEVNLLRELNKAVAGFLPLEYSKGRPVAVATGNWGCGAFKGDPKLKSLIQAAACGHSKRDLVYLTFTEEKLKNEIADLYESLQKKKITVGQLTKCLFLYNNNRNESGTDLYEFITKVLLSSDPPILVSRDNSSFPFRTSGEEANGNVTTVASTSKRITKEDNTNRKITEFFKSSSEKSDTKNAKKEKGLSQDQINAIVSAYDDDQFA